MSEELHVLLGLIPGVLYLAWRFRSIGRRVQRLSRSRLFRARKAPE